MELLQRQHSQSIHDSEAKHATQCEEMQAQLTEQREINRQLNLKITEQNANIRRTLRQVTNKVNSLNYNFEGDQNIPFTPKKVI